MLVQLWNLYDLPRITYNPTGVNLGRTFTNTNDLLAAKDKTFRDCEPGPGDQKKCWCQVSSRARQVMEMEEQNVLGSCRANDDSSS